MMPKKAKLYVYAIIAAGILPAVAAIPKWHSSDSGAVVLYLVLVFAGAGIKLRLPGLEGTYSINFLPLLFGLFHFQYSEMLIAACLSGLAQSVLNAKRRPQIVQIAFNMANVTLSIGACLWFLQAAQRLAGTFTPGMFCGVAVIYFCVNTVIVSGVLSLLEGKPLSSVWQSWYLWSFSYYLLGATLLALFSTSSFQNPEAWLVLVPIVYLLHFYQGLAMRPGVGTNEPGETPGLIASLPNTARFFVTAVVICGLMLLASTMLNWSSHNPIRFLVYFSVALVAATWKVLLPKMTGTISISFVILLFAVSELTLPEILVIAVTTACVQCLWNAKIRPAFHQVLFNMAAAPLGAAGAFFAFNIVRTLIGLQSFSIPLVVAALTMYSINTLLVAAVLCLVDKRPFSKICQNCCFWSFPYYMVGAVFSALMILASRTANWGTPLLAFSTMILIYVSYRTHIQRSAEPPLPPLA